MRIYTVYDRKAEESSPIFTAINDSVAKRMFKHLMDESCAMFIEDYDLYCIGCYEKENMFLEAFSPMYIDTDDLYSSIKVEVKENV